MRLVREREPDLAVVDIRMPPAHRTEGLEAARMIRAEFPDMGILILSAHVEAGRTPASVNPEIGAGHRASCALAVKTGTPPSTMLPPARRPTNPDGTPWNFAISGIS